MARRKRSSVGRASATRPARSELDDAVEQGARLWRRLRRDAPHLLELPHDAVGLARPRERVDELEPHREVRRRDAEDVAEPVAVALRRRGVGAARVELGERVQHVRVGAGVAAQLLERGARLGVAIRLRVDARERQPDLGAARIELARALELLLRLGVPAGLHVREAEVRVAERIVGREPGELGELGLGLGELIPLQVAEAEHARGVQLFHRSALGARTGDRRERGAGSYRRETSVTWGKYLVGPGWGKSGELVSWIVGSLVGF